MVTRRKFTLAITATAGTATLGGCSALVSARGETAPSPTAEPAPRLAPTMKPSESATPAGALAPPPAVAAAGALAFADDGHPDYGDWHADVTVTPANWGPGDSVQIAVTLRLPTTYAAVITAANATIRPEQICMLATAERTFDSDGWLRLPSDERMSTLLTPTGLAIEGGISGAVTNRYGYGYRTPLDEFVAVPIGSLATDGGQHVAKLAATTRLPADLPPGLYRLRLDFGFTANRRHFSLNGDGFAQRPPVREKATDCCTYSPLIRASGRHVSGRVVDAATLQPRIPWVLLGGYNANGYRGVVADEDRERFALSDRNIIHDEVILPLANEKGQKLTYSLEPQFPADVIDPRQNLAWDYAKGELSIEVTGPDGKVTSLGTAPFVEKRGFGPTTKRPAFTAWRPAGYGRYTVKATGWIADRSGNRYGGGGTYRFWIAKRLTLATATFQGMPYPVGTKYGRDIAFSPAVPADVEVSAVLYPDSDRARARTISYSGRASRMGIFGAAQGMTSFTFDSPGEYHAQILARYTDAEGQLWVSAMRHAGVVYPPDSPIVAHGKKLRVGKEFVERGETHLEGYVEPGDDLRHLAHVTFPYNAGDALLIASEHQGANKIEPVLTYEVKGQPGLDQSKIAGVGVSNIRIKTSNGYSPHLFPEYITDVEYYYGAAPRPGFMSRFIVGESNVRAPYWPTSPNGFGDQIGASRNGDTPGDIYRLIGGVVVRPQGKPPSYAGYLASAFILPKGTNNNRVVAPASEDVIASDGKPGRVLLVGTRPGLVYEVGATFAPAVQIDPIVPARIRYVLTYPDGRQKVAEGTGDAFGTFVGADRWPLDVPGVYRFTLEGDWQGHGARMPGLPAEGGEFYVLEPREARPAGASGLQLGLPAESAFVPTEGLRVRGKTSASTVRYAAVIPGAVIAQGALPVKDGTFEYFFDPQAISKSTPTYDVVNLSSGKPEIGRVVHLTFLAREVTSSGQEFHDFARVILRGTQVLTVRV